MAQLGYVMLGTNDLERAPAFYDALLGALGVGYQLNVFCAERRAE